LKILVSVVRFRPGPPRIQHRNDANDNATFGWRCRLFARLQFVRRSIPGLLLKQAIGLSLIAQAWLQHHFRIPFPLPSLAQLQACVRLVPHFFF
jgi:hypothetical protein